MAYFIVVWDCLLQKAYKKLCWSVLYAMI